MILTPNQVQTMHEVLNLIKTKLHNFEIPDPIADSYEVHKSIANARGQLHQLDHELFDCFRLLDKFTDSHRLPRTATPSSRGFTLDDL